MLEKSQMKINATKCMFGAKEGKFLGYYITREGIHPNPNNVKGIMETNPPRNLKEMH